MKKILLSTIVVFLMSCYVSAQTQIGKIENGVAQMTIDVNILKSKWENFLKTTGVNDANLYSFLIKESNGKYLIVSKDRTIRSGFVSTYGISLSNNGSLLFASGTSIVVTCTGSGGCTEGCSVEYGSAGYKCTPCIPEGQGECNKTETGTIGENSYF